MDIEIVRTPDQVALHRQHLADERRIAKARAHASEQKAERLRRVAKWGNRVAILQFYLAAQLMTRKTGIPHEVDHIIPLLGKLASGLHVEHNLQVLPKTENRAKSNRFDPDVMVGGESVELPTYAV